MKKKPRRILCRERPVNEKIANKIEGKQKQKKTET